MITGKTSSTARVSRHDKLKNQKKLTTKLATTLASCQLPKPIISRTAERSPVKRFIKSPVRARSK